MIAILGVQANFFLGCLILYLPSYSPDLNPIEESFSTRLFVSLASDEQSLNIEHP